MSGKLVPFRRMPDNGPRKIKEAGAVNSAVSDANANRSELTEEQRRRRCETVKRLCGNYAGKLSGSEELLEEKHHDIATLRYMRHNARRQVSQAETFSL